jgi:hypothetical protein
MGQVGVVLGQGLKIDWTIKVSDILKIGGILVCGALLYQHTNDRLTAVENQTTQMAVRLDSHIAQQNGITQQLVDALNKMNLILENFPPHRHTKNGDIIYPSSDMSIAPIRK